MIIDGRLEALSNMFSNINISICLREKLMKKMCEN